FRDPPPGADRRAAKRAFISTVQTVMSEYADSGDATLQTRAIQIGRQMQRSRRSGTAAPGSPAIQEIDPDAAIAGQPAAQADVPPAEAPAFRPSPAALAAATGDRPAEYAARAAPTGRPPVPGRLPNTFAQHRARGSNGVDLAGRLGDPVEAPASGTVKAVG